MFKVVCEMVIRQEYEIDAETKDEAIDEAITQMEDAYPGLEAVPLHAQQLEKGT